MNHQVKKRILFDGYAPVHSLSFRPIHDLLLQYDRVVAVCRGLVSSVNSS